MPWLYLQNVRDANVLIDFLFARSVSYPAVPLEISLRVARNKGYETRLRNLMRKT